MVATIGLAILILFVYKDEDLRFMEFRKKTEKSEKTVDAEEKSEED